MMARENDKIMRNHAPKLLEPLITICLKKAMEYLNAETELIHPEHDKVLYNVNSVSDYEFAKPKMN